MPTPRAHGRAALPRPERSAARSGTSCSAARGGARRSSSCRSTTRSGCSTRRARPACRRRSSTARAAILLEHLKMLRLHLDVAARRPLLLVHDHRLDDVELPRRRPADRRGDRALRRQPGAPGPRTCSGTSPSRPGITCFGTSAAYIAACMKAGVEPARGRDLGAAAQRRLDRLAALARGLPLGLRPRRRRHLALLDERRHRRLHARSSAACRRCPSTRASCRRARSARRSRRSTRTATRSSTQVGELVLTEPMPSMPVSFWGDADGCALPRELLRDVPGRLAPRRLDRDHLARHGDHLRPLATRRSTAAACGWGRARSTAPCSRVDEVVDALVVDVPREGTDGWMPLFVVLRDGRELDDELVARDPARGCARTARRATSPTRSAQSPRSRARSRARSSRCR